MYVFINKEHPYKIKMIDALSETLAYIYLAKRLSKEHNSGKASDYYFGYNI